MKKLKRIVIFDFDKTITKKDSFNDFLIFTFGKFKFWCCIFQNIFSILLYKLHKLTNAQVKSRMFKYFYNKKLYNDYVKDCQKYVKFRLDDIIRDDIKLLIQDYKENDFELVLLSASFKEWLEPWAKKNQFSKVICSRFTKNDNFIIGNIIEEESCYGKNKVNMLLKEFPNLQKNYSEIIAYGDSKSDYYFMDLATTKYKVLKNKIVMLDEEAIITDGLWRKSVSAIRAVGKTGVKVTVTGDTFLTIGMWSKFCSKKKKVINASTDKTAFGKDILKICKDSLNKPVLFPMEEPTILWCSEHREELEKVCYTLLADKESMKIALNKSETIKVAMKIDVPCPKSYFPKDVVELKKIIEKEKLQDYVIKPYHGSGSSGLLYGSLSQEIDLNEHWQKYGELILQERIPADGEGVGVSIIMDRNHEVKGVFAHKRLEQYPNSGGPSTQRIGIRNEKLVSNSIKLLKALNWVGVAMVEWKFDTVKKEYVLMEINPRFWGSLELSVRSGVNFPFLYYQLAKKRYVKKIDTYSVDKVCRWLIPGDVLRYLTKKNRESLSKFLKGFFKNSEEWDKEDKRCFFASIICQGLLILNPKYWKYIRK